MINPRELKFEEEEEDSSIDDRWKNNMLPITLARENAQEAFADGSNTPLRAGFVRLPRLRLLDKHFKLDTVPIYAARKDKSNPIRSFVQRYKNLGGIIPASQCSADRFIPRRKGQNLEAAYHSLVQAEPPKKPCERVLDLPNDLNCMGFAWQKRSMARALETIIPGSGRQRILQLSLPKTSFVTTVPGSRAGRLRNFEESSDAQDEYKWPVRPRRHPVIGPPDTILDIPHFRPSLRKSLLDWSSRNMIAAVIDHGSRHGVCVVNGDVNLNTNDTQFLFHDRCTAVKFSNSGDEIAIGMESSITTVYRMNPNKVLFEFRCVTTNHAVGCQPQTYAWSKNDQYLIAGCSSGCLAVANVTDKKTVVKVVQASLSEIVAVSFSPNDGYIACCGREPAVRIFTWPDLIAFMEIGYCSPVRAMAWHPWESSVLCIGGGPGDGGLSIWNVPRHMSLSYRSINFDGTADTIAWNKITGELLVNWFVRERDQCFVAMPIYETFDRISDSIVPTLRKNRILYTAWSPDGSHIACQARESVFMYNFIDKQTKDRLEQRQKGIRGGEKNTKSISCHNIR